MKERRISITVRVPEKVVAFIPHEKHGDRSRFIVRSLIHFIETNEGRKNTKRLSPEVLKELQHAIGEVHAVGVNLNQVTKLLHQQGMGAEVDLRPDDVKNSAELAQEQILVLKQIIAKWRVK